MPVLQCSQDDAADAPEIVAKFVAGNYLEGLVVSDLARTSPKEHLRRAIDQAGLGRHSVSWIDITSLSGEQLPKV